MPPASNPLPTRLVAIDWSGRVDAAGQRRHIWAATWTAAEHSRSGRPTFQLESGRTRSELIDWLIGLAQKTPNLVAGFDCCFSFPAWFLEEHGCDSALEFWRHCAAGHAEQWLARDCPDERFWGKPRKKPAQFCGDHTHRMLRRTDVEGKITALMTDPAKIERVRGIAPKSPFQIGGAGAVGTGSLRAMPHLLHLHDAGWGVWPFFSSRDEGGSHEMPRHPGPLAIEIYTRLLTGPVVKSSAEARIAYLRARKLSHPAYAAIPGTVLTKARGSEDAFDALVSLMGMVEHREALAGLVPTADPIYRLEGQTWSPETQTSQVDQ